MAVNKQYTTSYSTKHFRNSEKSGKLLFFKYTGLFTNDTDPANFKMQPVIYLQKWLRYLLVLVLVY